jgi:hypothetical protein
MLAMLEWASEHPGWHEIGELEAAQKAAELLAEVWPDGVIPQAGRKGEVGRSIGGWRGL